uniref:Major capsid protein N-terminal domain-containing protein n=1 Tax=viral metagenome TaxID=1070528 RepID=A0A6C0HM77_9ZZZZ
MEGSLTQLGFTNYLINKAAPAVSFFQYAYKNYANYVKDTRVLSFKNGFNFGATSSFRFDEDGKYGDLVTNIVIEATLPDISKMKNVNGHSIGYCNGVGNALTQNIYLRVGGNLIDQHSSEWLDIWSQLAIKPGVQAAYNTMIQRYEPSTFTTTTFQGGKVYIPLQFWFCRNITQKNSSLIFPLMNLFDSTIELALDIRSFKSLIVSDDNNTDIVGLPPIITDANIIVDYVVIEEPERVKFLSQPRQLFLMNQVQTLIYGIQAGTTNTTFTLKSLHYLVTELIFVVRRNDASNNNDYFNYSNSIKTGNRENPIKTLRLTFDGRDKIRTTEANIFSLLEPGKIHTNAPQNAFIHCVGFSLEPEKIEQPNGVCNFSEIQEPLLTLELAPNIPASTLFIYAVNYNVLQSMTGTGYLLHMLSKSIPAKLSNKMCNDGLPRQEDTNGDSATPVYNNDTQPYKF